MCIRDSGGIVRTAVIAEYRLVDLFLAQHLSRVSGQMLADGVFAFRQRQRRITCLLYTSLRPGGVLAVQIPVQQSQPMHRIIAETARREKWRMAFPAPPRAFHNLQQNEYFDMLGELTQEFTMWEITYYHRMPSHAAMLEWYRATGCLLYTSRCV